MIQSRNLVFVIHQERIYFLLRNEEIQVKEDKAPNQASGEMKVKDMFKTSRSGQQKQSVRSNEQKPVKKSANERMRHVPTTITSSIPLRPYQAECIRQTLELFERRNVTRQLISLPVGSGKSLVFAHIVNELKPKIPTATKSLILAHREELLEQAKLGFSIFFPFFWKF